MQQFWASSNILEKTKLSKQWFLGTRSESKKEVGCNLPQEAQEIFLE